MKRSVTKDLNEAAKKLLQSKEEDEKTTHSETIPTSRSPPETDSGVGSRDLSRSLSIASLEPTPENFDPLQSINEDVQQQQQPSSAPLEHTLSKLVKEMACPVKITLHEEATTDFKEPERNKRAAIESSNLLSVIPTRKHSACSSTASDEFHTPPTTPTSPVLLISRSVSVDSTSSSSFTSQETMKVEVQSPDTNQWIRIKAKGLKVKNLHVNIYLQAHAHSGPSPSFASLPNSPSLPSSATRTGINRDLPTHTTCEEPPSTSQQCSCVGQRRDNPIADIIRRHLLDFYDSTDLESLYPCLYKAGLISKKDWEDLQGLTNSRARMNFLYIHLLSSKGPWAYEALFECLREEQEHVGHQYLVRILERELRLSTVKLPSSPEASSPRIPERVGSPLAQHVY